MASSYNKAILVGNLGRDPEQRYSQNNFTVTSFSMATSFSRKDRDGNWVDETSWHNIVAFNLSEYTLGQLKKGSKVLVEGRITYNSYEKDGVKRYTTEINAERVVLLDSRSGGNAGGYQSGNSEGGQIESMPANDDNEDLPF